MNSTNPSCILHTQFNAELPWADINMNYMNTHQSATKFCREFGYIGTRMRKERKSGSWSLANQRCTNSKWTDWCRVAAGWNESQNLRIALWRQHAPKCGIDRRR